MGSTPIADVREISNIGYGFMASKALFAALEIDLFTRLALGPMRLEHLARDLGVPANRLQTLLLACTSLGLLSYVDGSYSNAPACQTFLVKGEPYYYGDYFKYQVDRQIYSIFSQLGAAVRGDAQPKFYGITQDTAEAEAFTRAQHFGSSGPARVLARRVRLGNARRLLDVAGGSGAFSIALCEHYPDLTATVMDFPAVVHVAKQYVLRADLSDRITILAGDVLEANWPRDQDVVLMSYLLYCVSANDIDELLSRAWDALAPGGLLLIHDFVVEDSGAGPQNAALWMLHGLLSNADAVCLTHSVAENAIHHAGFRSPMVEPLIPGITSLMTAQKP